MSHREEQSPRLSHGSTTYSHDDSNSHALEIISLSKSRTASFSADDAEMDSPEPRHSFQNVVDSSGLDDDPNIDPNYTELEEDSPYPEVRSAVANADDFHMPAGTIRAWTIGLLCAILIPGLNQFLFFRYPTIYINTFVIQLLSFLIGLFWARFFPRFKIFGIEINPGPFTIKEHVIITIMAGVGSEPVYATMFTAVQRVYYNQQYSFTYQWVLVISTQLIGFSIGGIAQRYLVTPPSMIWPTNLVYCALFNTLHSQEYAGIGHRKGMSRQTFFVLTFVCATAWYFLPGYLFTALSVFSWVCWIRPNDIIINQLFGYNSGLGMSLFTFDWAQIAYIGSPLATPWWVQVNVAAGFIVFFWIITPILYYKNIWHSQYMPVMSRGSYDNTGNAYNVTRILTPDATLDLEKYKAYSPLFLSTTFAVSYGLSFASITATLMHAFLYFRKQIYSQATRSLREQPDIHARLMSRYPRVPEWWYMVVFVTMFLFGILSIELWPTQMPIWAFILALFIAFIYILPVGMIQAITNQQVDLNIVTELVIGYALPGRPAAMMMFKTWGSVTMTQGLQFSSDLRLGHYMKIPPRTMFWCQIVASVIAGTVQLGIQSWMFTNIPGMCDPHQHGGFICPNTEVFYTASIIWGVIGPALQFSKGQVYYVLLFSFLIGAIAPIITWAITRKYPKSFFKYINIPVILGGTSYIPPANASNYVPYVIVGFIFQYVIRRRHFAWWTKYNYVLSAALDSSVAIGTVVIFFCLRFPQNGQIGSSSIQSWWGNTVYLNTVDYNQLPLRTVPEGSVYGPSSW